MYTWSLSFLMWLCFPVISLLLFCLVPVLYLVSRLGHQRGLRGNYEQYSDYAYGIGHTKQPKLPGEGVCPNTTRARSLWYRPCRCVVAADGRQDRTLQQGVPFQVLTITGGHIKLDLRYTQKTIYSPIFTNNIWSYLLWSPVIGAMQRWWQRTSQDEEEEDVPMGEETRTKQNKQYARAPQVRKESGITRAPCTSSNETLEPPPPPCPPGVLRGLPTICPSPPLADCASSPCADC